ncbi:hypothetical protein [Streptomyces griseus]|uniref:hypothetical protein n=1 Tax=Streptomyces griseus TaxID=1911 RepID=UPI0004C85CEC|nr:hypothetical protein [Streptomyces griseus]
MSRTRGAHDTGDRTRRRTTAFRTSRPPEEVLPQAEAAVAAHEEGGPQGELARAEAVRVAALIEGNGLDRAAEAVARLTAAAARCRGAELPEAAHVLDTLRRELLSR